VVKVAMPQTVRVRDVMTVALVVLRSDTKLIEAWHQLHAAGITGAPVIDAKGRLAGLLSLVDLADPRRSLTDESTVADAMTRLVYAVRAEDPLVQAVHLMIQERIHRVVVVNDDGSLAGIVVPMDILRAVVTNDSEPPAFVDLRELAARGA